MKPHVKVPVWLGEIVKYHMERLRLLSLDGAPPAVAMAEVTRIWAETLAGRGAWVRELDASRLHQAFLALEAHCDRWPTPNQLWQHLPARPQRPALPAPKLDEAGRRQRLERIAAIRELLKNTRP